MRGHSSGLSVTSPLQKPLNVIVIITITHYISKQMIGGGGCICGHARTNVLGVGLALQPPTRACKHMMTIPSARGYKIYYSNQHTLRVIGCLKRPGIILESSLGNSFNTKSGAGFRKAGIVWYRNDLRLHDHEALSRACAECTSILPVYCFDPREYGTMKNRKYGKTGPYRATFVIDAVRDLRERLRERGSDLMVVIGKPEEVLPEIARKVGASALYCHTEVTYEEAQVESRVKHIFLQESGGIFHSFWTNTLHDVGDLPSGLANLPQSFDEFKSTMEGIGPRHSVDEQTSLKPTPLGTFQVGEIPSLEDLGMSPLESVEGDEGSSFPSCRGGESEALRQLEKFMSAIAAKKKASTSFSGNIAPWLASGCLSPRKMMESVMKKSQVDGGELSLTWIQFELLWRDFFRMLTRRLTENAFPKVYASGTACI